MSRLSDFFKDKDTEFGVFYPKHCLLAVFETPAEAGRAKGELIDTGLGEDNVISVSGEEVVLFAEDHLVKDGLWGALMAQLSRTIGTEELYADKDLAAAKKGAAFVVVHCEGDSAKSKAWNVLKPTHPLVARYYALAGIEHLAGET